MTSSANAIYLCNSSALHRYGLIEGFHRVTFVSNFDVNVEIGGHFGDQERFLNKLWPPQAPQARSATDQENIMAIEAAV